MEAYEFFLAINKPVVLAKLQIQLLAANIAAQIMNSSCHDLPTLGTESIIRSIKVYSCLLLICGLERSVDTIILNSPERQGTHFCLVFLS